MNLTLLTKEQISKISFEFNLTRNKSNKLDVPMIRAGAKSITFGNIGPLISASGEKKPKNKSDYRNRKKYNVAKELVGIIKRKAIENGIDRNYFLMHVIFNDGKRPKMWSVIAVPSCIKLLNINSDLGFWENCLDWAYSIEWYKKFAQDPWLIRTKIYRQYVLSTKNTSSNRGSNQNGRIDNFWVEDMKRKGVILGRSDESVTPLLDDLEGV